MKKRIFLGGLLLAIAFTNANAATSDFQSLEDATTLIADTESMVSKVIEFGSFIFGWIITLGFGVGGYYVGYQKFKEIDEQDRSGNTNTTMIHAKAAGVSLVALIVGSMIFTFIFVKILAVGSTTADAMKTVLKISTSTFQ